MTGEKWTIYWSEYSSDTYLYGSEIWYHAKNSVEFRNELMPPGTVIKQWYSKTNYQAQRIEPALPMIDGESAYRMTVYIDCQEGEAWMVRLVFYDKYDVEAGSAMIRDQVTDFRCPLKTYSYRMQLINGGMKQFCFHSIEIQEIEPETEDTGETKHRWWKRRAKKRKKQSKKEISQQQKEQGRVKGKKKDRRSNKENMADKKNEIKNTEQGIE